MTIVLYGDSVLCGFASTLGIPESCHEPWTRIDEHPLLNLSGALARYHPVQVCALPGLGSKDTLEWHAAVPQWHHLPAIFSLGRNDWRRKCSCLIPALEEIDRRQTGPWWFMAIPALPGEEDRETMFTEANAGAEKMFPANYIDPGLSAFGTRVPPREYRLDRVHLNDKGNRLIADWLIKHTIGARHGAEHQRAA